MGKARVAAWIAAALGLFVAVDLTIPPPLERGMVVSKVVLDKDGGWVRGYTTPQGRWRLAARLSETDPNLINAIIGVEDQRFWLHPGVDPLAMTRAIGSFLVSGRVTSGGSTISMQTARLLEPRSRSPLSKALEMLRAFQIERRFSKRDILSLYLTLAPYGGNLEGVRAASRAYFGREPQDLSTGSIALLLALPQAPEGRRPDRRPEAAQSGRLAALRKMQNTGLITAADLREGASEPLPVRRPFPTVATHIADRVARLAPRDGRVVSTLDTRLQALVERRLLEASPSGATAAGIVVELPGREVRALIGSANAKATGGLVDMSAAFRSPGSTLKPFIYALAFDDGVAAPDSLVEDMPTRFGAYSPENFDRVFNGEVRVRDALQHSLNVPAVAALDRVGAARFRAALESTGMRMRLPRRDDRDPGLALALGGIGIRMDDLAMIYAGLADNCKVTPLVWTMVPKPTIRRETQFCAPESAEKITEILKRAPTPAGRVPGALADGAPDVAAKTGTSYGFRDAWAAGYTDRYAVVVWVGRPDGTPRTDSTGRTDALPVLLDIFDLIGDAKTVRAEPNQNEQGNGPKRMTRGALEGAGPAIAFPPDGAVLLMNDQRGFVLSARGGVDPVTWYVDGKPIPREGDRAIWKPESPGFFTVSAIDGAGIETKARVRLRKE